MKFVISVLDQMLGQMPIRLADEGSQCIYKSTPPLPIDFWYIHVDARSCRLPPRPNDRSFVQTLQCTRVDVAKFYSLGTWTHDTFYMPCPIQSRYQSLFFNRYRPLILLCINCPMQNVLSIINGNILTANQNCHFQNGHLVLSNAGRSILRENVRNIA